MSEPKPTESRIGRSNQRYNEESGARMVAGCICLNESKDKVIMISSSHKPDKWILPKGGIELDETDDFIVTALRETWEEAGVEGRIISKLPIVYDKRGKTAPVIKGDFNPDVNLPKTEFHMYELIVDNLSQVWPESDSRQRRWCTYSEAKHELIKAKRLELVDALNQSGIKKDVPNDIEDEY
ncbi:Diadenosine and Diphosphoinositol polyphosphate Phosphohydrolase [Scheffersomyces coipomensis]|uniref:Diadenosine and Diphosphoinositol polyphosphate Phosphohydrolase n=1 Tax=Scheffersomyces coipomensis TaxID=1788519 RepID=UPI00315D4908